MPLAVADHFSGLSLESFPALPPRALPLPPLLITSLPPSHPPFPSSPFSFVTSHCLWPCAFHSPACGLVPPLSPLVYPRLLFRLPLFSPPRTSGLANPITDEFPLHHATGRLDVSAGWRSPSP